MSDIVSSNDIENKKMNDNNLQKQIASYFNKELHVIVTDGRVIIGRFQCIDWQGSLVLESATEYYGINDDHVDISKPDACIKFVQESYDLIQANQTTDELVSRSMSMLVIPGNHVVSCHALIED